MFYPHNKIRIKIQIIPLKAQRAAQIRKISNSFKLICEDLPSIFRTIGLKKGSAIDTGSFDRRAGQ